MVEERRVEIEEKEVDLRFGSDIYSRIHTERDENKERPMKD